MDYRMSVMGIKMLRWICGVIREVRIRDEYIRLVRETVGIA